MKHTRSLAVFLALALSLGIFSGCSGASSAPSSAPASAASDTTSISNQEFSYPMSDGDPISYWMELNSNISTNFASMEDTPYAQGLMERTGITIDYEHPPAGQASEQFGLIVADGNMPDIIEYDFLSGYSGGPEKAIKDGVILELSDIIDQYCPNLKAYLEANPDVDKMIKTDSGNYYTFPMIRGNEELCTFLGLYIRDDLLTEYNLEMPSTLEDWHTVLTTFKENGIEYPLTTGFAREDIRDSNPFVFAAGVGINFYLGDDGQVHYGPAEENYKTYLSTFAQWYSEGLIDPDFASLNLDQVSSKMTTGTSAVTWGYVGSHLGAWIPAGRETNPDYSLSAAPFVAEEKGSTPEYGYTTSKFGGYGASITTSCKDVERAARLLDYLYSEEGALYTNFGEEGVSYTMSGSEPVYTDLILNNPDGWSVGQAMSAYCTAPINAPHVQDARYLAQYYVLPQQQNAPATFAATNASAHALPPISPTPEESSEYNSIMNEIKTYQDEMEIKFILGTESLDNFDAYVETLQKMGLARALEIQNAALERYNAR